MNLPDQVLSIDQVRELTELGFDVSKYASMCWLKEPNGDKLLITTLDESCYEAACMNPVPTLTIGDIIDILPETIILNNINYPQFHDKFNIKIMLNKTQQFFSYDRGGSTLCYFVEEKLIDTLFKALVWCITEKHI